MVRELGWLSKNNQSNGCFYLQHRLYIKGWGKSSTQDYKKYYNQFTTNLFWRTANAYGYDSYKQRKHQDKRSDKRQ